MPKSLRRDGAIDFEAPDRVMVSLDSVPQRYTALFGELGTPRTWPIMYVLTVEKSELADGHQIFELDGVPRENSDVDRVHIRLSDESRPINAVWFLHSGWTISATIDLELAQDNLVPAHEHVDIAGQGMKIDADMTFGDYRLNT